MTNNNWETTWQDDLDVLWGSSKDNIKAFISELLDTKDKEIQERLVGEDIAVEVLAHTGINTQ